MNECESGARGGVLIGEIDNEQSQSPTRVVDAGILAVSLLSWVVDVAVTSSLSVPSVLKPACSSRWERGWKLS